MKIFKRIVSTILCILLVICTVSTTVTAGDISDNILSDTNSANTFSETEETTRHAVVDLTTRKDFGFGVNVHNKGYAAYPEVYLEEQIHAVAKTGAKWLRINVGIQTNNDWTYCDQVVGLANKYGLKIIMILFPDTSMGLDYITYCFKVYATRYNGENGRGFVDVFQAWNEVDITCLQAKYGSSVPNGKDENHYFTIPVEGYYDLPEWFEYFEAAEKGVHSKESNSKFLVNYAATHYGFIHYMLRNGLNLDYVGWDEYSYYPYDLEKSASTLESLLDEVENNISKKYNVPLIVCETNVSIGSLNQSDRENPTLESHNVLIDYMYMFYNRDWIKAAIFYELLDEPAFGRYDPESWFGLIKHDGSGKIKPENEKPIYKEITKLLKGNENLPVIKRNEIDLTPYDNFDTTFMYTVNNGEATIKQGTIFCNWDIVIPSNIDDFPVTGIGFYAFRDCPITNITLLDSVISIGEAAFYNCKNLSCITIPQSVEFIDYSAFERCSALKTVNYGGSKADWEKIKIYDGNSYLTQANINFAKETEHIYTNAHDPICDDCGEVREVEPCVFTNSCDTKCNICGDIRKITHSFIEGTIICKICGFNGISHPDYINSKYAKGYGWADLDNDGSISYDDLKLLNFAVCGVQFGDGSAICKAADVNGDGKIDTKDIVRIKKILGIIPGGGVGSYTTLNNIPNYIKR